MGDMLPVIVLGIIILLGLVAMFLSHKTWPIYTILLLFFNVVTAAGFVYLGARTLKTYHVWRTEQTDWVNIVKDKTKEVEGKIHGTGEGDEAVSLAELETRLSKALDQRRSKAWGLLDADSRGVIQGPPIVANITANGNVVTAELTWRLPIPPQDLGLEPKMAVFLFGDSQADPQAGGYYGKYIINTVEPKRLTLTRAEPLLVGNPGEPEVTVNGRPVIIYENFPNDDYRTFAGKTLAELKQMVPGVPDETLNDFVKHGKPVTAAEEQALLDQAAIDDQAKTALTDLNKAHVWHRVKVKELLPLSEISGKVAPVAPPVPMPGEEENPMPAEEVLPATFGLGTKILLDPDTAKQLVGTGKVEYDGADYRVYMRPLRDYPSEYKRIRENFVDLTAAIGQIERLEALNATTKASTEATIKHHEARTALINEDLANLKKETAALAGYETQIRQRVAGLQKEQRTLLDNISKLAAAVTQFQMEALRKVNSQISAQDQAAAAP